jgi:hypothetical protein
MLQAGPDPHRYNQIPFEGSMQAAGAGLPGLQHDSQGTYAAGQIGEGTATRESGRDLRVSTYAFA